MLKFKVTGFITGQGSPFYKVSGSTLCFDSDCQNCELREKKYMEELSVEQDSFGNYNYDGYWAACEWIELSDDDTDYDIDDYFKEKYEGWG